MLCDGGDGKDGPSGEGGKRNNEVQANRRRAFQQRSNSQASQNGPSALNLHQAARAPVSVACVATTW